MIVGERLAQFIKKSYKIQKEFAEFTKISAQQVNNYVTGRSKPSIDVLEKFVRAGLNSNWLLTGEGIMFADNIAGTKFSNATNGNGINDNTTNATNHQLFAVSFLTTDELRKHIREAVNDVMLTNSAVKE